MLAGRPFERRSRSSSVCGRHDLCRAWRGVDWRAASRKWQFLAGEAEVVLKGGEKSGAMVWRFDFTTGSSAAVLVGRVCGLASSSPPPGPCPKASSSDGAIASPFRLEVALSLMSIRCPEYAASSRAASESTPKADLPPMDRAALGSRAGLSRCSPRQPPIARAALSALRSFLAPLLGKSSIATSTRLIRTNPACRAIRFLWMLGSTAPRVNDLSTDR